MGNVVPPPSSGTSLPEVLSSVVRPPRYQTVRGPALTVRSQTLWKSFRNDPSHGSDNWPKLTDLKSESVIGFIPES